VTVLAGYGLDALLDSLKRTVGELRINQTRFWIAGIVVGLAVLFFAAIYQEPNGGPSVEVLRTRIVRGAIWFTSALIVFYLASKLHAVTQSPTLVILLVGVVAFDVVLYAYPQIHQGRRPAELNYIDPDNSTEIDLYSAAFFEAGDPVDWGRVNVAADNGVRLLNMYTGVIPARMSRVINILTGRPASAPQEENHLQLDVIARPDLLDYLGVRYLLIAPGQNLDHDQSLQDRGKFDNMRNMENTDALPFAFVVADFNSVSSPTHALELVERTSDLRLEAVTVEGIIEKNEATCPESGVQIDRISNLRLEGGNLKFDFESAQPGILIINQTYQNGWEGWIDGEPSMVYPVNYRWMGMNLPCPGEHQIHLRYLPTSLVVGLVISASTMVLLLIISLVLLYRSRKEMF
jgi:hypothetical protein